MGKLKRSCVAGSFVLHAVIIALLVLGPVLLAKREEKVQVIDLIPSEIVDQILTQKHLLLRQHQRKQSLSRPHQNLNRLKLQNLNQSRPHQNLNRLKSQNLNEKLMLI